MKKKMLNYLTVTIGIALLVTGLVLLKLITESQGIMLVLPYVCIGLGCGTLGHGFGNIANDNVPRKYPQRQKQIEIEKNDERNIAISNQAKAKAYDIMIYVFSALIISFALMRVDIVVILLLIFAYLFVVGLFIYYSSKYHKEG